jgi:hypothetical protein
MVLLLWVRCEVCEAIAVKSYCCTRGSAEIKAIFNNCCGTVVFHIGKFYFKVLFNCNFELFEENCMKIITTGQIFLSNYKLSRFPK